MSLYPKTPSTIIFKTPSNRLNLPYQSNIDERQKGQTRNQQNEIVVHTNNVINSLNQNESLVHSNNDRRSKLIITVLSMHELPLDDTTEPQNVTLEALGKVLEIGPPISRHKHKHNDFKYAKQHEQSNNEFVILAPLSSLYQSILKFNIILSSIDHTKTLKSDLTKVGDIASFNETKSFILPLRYTSNKDKISSTMRVNIRLETMSYRTEISILRSICSNYFRLVDTIHPYVQSASNYFINLPYPSTKKLVLYSIIPASIFILTILPIITILFVFGFPLFIPLFMIILVLVTMLTSSILIFYASTKDKRLYIYNTILHPLYSSFISTSIGQELIYNTGSRPTPKHILSSMLSTNNILCKLCMALFLDTVGSSTYLLPIIGESFDLIWAPLQYYCITTLFDKMPLWLKHISFLEEILPFTDILPSATIACAWEYYYGHDSLSFDENSIVGNTE